MLNLTEEGLQVIRDLVGSYEAIALKIYEGNWDKEASTTLVDAYFDLKPILEDPPDFSKVDTNALSVLWLKLDDIIPLELESEEDMEEWGPYMQAFDYIHGLISLHNTSEN